MCNKGSLLYEGKAKKIYETDSPQKLWVEYKDDATAFNGVKHGVVTSKGRLNNAISEILFGQLSVPHHFVRKLSLTEQLVTKVEILPLEVVVRNIAAGSICKRLGIAEGTSFSPPLVEFFYKNDALHDPLITLDHIRVMGLATESQVETLKELALQVNDEIGAFLQKHDLLLVDFKLEFGLDCHSQILLADEVSPDTCRIWDMQTREKLDKDRFRFDLGDLVAGYQVILERIGGDKCLK